MTKPRLVYRNGPRRHRERGPRRDREAVFAVRVLAVRARLPRRVLDPPSPSPPAGQMPQRKRTNGINPIRLVGHRKRHRHQLRRHQPRVVALSRQRGVVPVADEAEGEGGGEGGGGAVYVAGDGLLGEKEGGRVGG